MTKDIIDFELKPHKFLDALKKKLKCGTDADLNRILKVGAPVTSKIRHGHMGISANFILIVHERTGIPVADIRAMMK
jgi:hypothetical protein